MASLVRWSIISALVLIGGLTAYLVGTTLSVRTPTHDDMRLVFERQRDSFSALAQIFTSDPTVLYASGSLVSRNHGDGKTADTIPSESEKSLYDQTGTLCGRRDGVVDLRFISFTTFREDMDVSTLSERLSKEKGYAYFLTDDESVRRLVGTAGTYGNVEFQLLEGPWYTYTRIRVSKPE